MSGDHLQTGLVFPRHSILVIDIRDMTGIITSVAEIPEPFHNIAGIRVMKINLVIGFKTVGLGNESCIAGRVRGIGNHDGIAKRAGAGIGH